MQTGSTSEPARILLGKDTVFIPLVGRKLLAVSFITVDAIHIILVLNMDYVTSGIILY